MSFAAKSRRLALATVLLAGASMAQAEITKPVKTAQGLVSGTAALKPGVTVFKGIPFAEAPVGKLRFMSAVPVKTSWKGVRDGHLVTVATSHALVTSASYDSGSNAFVLTTAPITKGAFLGSTLTWRFAWGDFDDHHRICTTLDAAYSGFSSANGLPWTLEVP